MYAATATGGICSCLRNEICDIFSSWLMDTRYLFNARNNKEKRYTSFFFSFSFSTFHPSLALMTSVRVYQSSSFFISRRRPSTRISESVVICIIIWCSFFLLSRTRDDRITESIRGALRISFSSVFVSFSRVRFYFFCLASRSVGRAIKQKRQEWETDGLTERATASRIYT